MKDLTSTKTDAAYSPSVKQLLDHISLLSTLLGPPVDRRLAHHLNHTASQLQQSLPFTNLSLRQIKTSLLWGALERVDHCALSPPANGYNQWEEQERQNSYEKKEQMINRFLRIHYRPPVKSQVPSETPAHPVTLYLLSGIPGSGKSTWVETQHHKQFQHTTLISSDALREHLYGHAQHQLHNQELFAFIRQRVRHHLAHRESVVLDATNLLKIHRRPFLNLARHANARCVVVILDTPLEVALQRNQQRDRYVPDVVIASYFLQWQRPRKNEADERWVVTG